MSGLEEDMWSWKQDAEAWRWLCDHLPEDFDGDGALESLIADALGENKRLREAEALSVERQRKLDEALTERDRLRDAIGAGTFSMDWSEEQQNFVLFYCASYDKAEALKSTLEGSSE